MATVPGRLTYANIMSTLAVVLAVSAGGAYAAGQVTSKLIKNETIKSVDVKNGGLTGVDLADGTVTGAKITDGAVTGAKVSDGSVTGADVGNDSLTGADIDESTLALAPGSVAVQATGVCTADGGALTTCVTVPITLPKQGRLLATAAGSWTTFALDGPGGADDPLRVRGRCQLSVDGAVFGAALKTGERAPSGNPVHDNGSPGSMALSGLSGALAAGAHTVKVECAEEDADLDWPTIDLTVLGLPG